MTNIEAVSQSSERKSILQRVLKPSQTLSFKKSSITDTSGQELFNYSPIREGIISNEVGGDLGSHANVFDLRTKINNKEYIVKIGQWKNYRFPLIKKIPVSLSRKLLDNAATRLFNTKSVECYPTPEHTMRAYKEEYLPIKKYLSPEKEDNQKNPRQELLSDLRNPQSELFKEMQKLLGNEKPVHKLGRIFEKNINYNFLKEEQVTIGFPRDLSEKKIEALRNKNKPLPTTYYIFQEKVVGDIVSLSNIDEETLIKRPLVMEKLITLALLQRKMFKDTGKLMDNRPDELLRHPWEWFQETDNILIDKNSDNIFAVDTRWLWNNEARIMGKKWFNLIDNLGRKSIDRAIKKYANILDSKR